MSQVDTTIEAVFGPAPEGIDLTASITAGYDIVSCVVLGLSAIAVAIRFYVRTRHNTQKKNLGKDDYTILLGLVSYGYPFAIPLAAELTGSNLCHRLGVY